MPSMFDRKGMMAMHGKGDQSEGATMLGQYIVEWDETLEGHRRMLVLARDELHAICFATRGTYLADEGVVVLPPSVGDVKVWRTGNWQA